MFNIVCDYCEEEKELINDTIISKKLQPGLKACIYNRIRLCGGCHNKYKVDKSLEKLYKQTLQTQLFSLLEDDYLSVEDISERLAIKACDVQKILKLIHPTKGYKYSLEDVVRACMGGKLIVEGQKWN